MIQDICLCAVRVIKHEFIVHSLNNELLRAALRDGPKKLSATRKIRLLGDPVALSELHMMVWTSPDTHESWREAVATASQVIEFPRRKSAPAELTSAA